MPSPSPTARRPGPDACPGVLSVWDAADGGLARVRLPGGVLSVEGMQALADAAQEIGNGLLELTKRGNVQVRGLPAGAERELAARLRPVGLLPSDAHERVRNIVASPLTGLISDRPDVLPVVGEIDDGLLDDPDLALLPGRFLFAVDDGAGDVSGLDADVTLIARGGTFAVFLGGTDVGLRVADPAGAALACARGFLAERAAQGSAAWRVAELTDGPARIAARMSAEVVSVAVRSTPELPTTIEAGRHRQRDGRVAEVVAIPDGRLDVVGARELAARSSGQLRVTPWRSVVLPHLETA